MPREIPRTVTSFLPPYQLGLRQGDVEIIILDNGSSQPVPEDVRARFGPTVRYVKVPDPKPSPAYALNYGACIAKAPVLCPVIDGARMASPGLLSLGLSAMSLPETKFVASVGFHLGPKRQSVSVLEGYNQSVEDELLASIDWMNNGYRLFEISALAGSAGHGWFGPISESNAPLIGTDLFNEIGGFDERFDFAGGGIVNLDFFREALEASGGENAPDAPEARDYVLLLGEATFHQIHGGVTTSKDVRAVEADGRTTFQRYQDQYTAIRGKPFKVPQRKPLLWGGFRQECYSVFDPVSLGAGD